jgi:hypothetical protein
MAAEDGFDESVEEVTVYTDTASWAWGGWVAELASAGRQIIVLVVVGSDARSMPLGAGLVPEGGEVILVVILLGRWVTPLPWEPWLAPRGLLPCERLWEQRPKLLPMRSRESRAIKRMQQQWPPLRAALLLWFFFDVILNYDDFWKEGGGVS